METRSSSTLRFSRCLDFFVPPEWPEGTGRNQARNVVALLMAYLLMAPPFLALFIWQDHTPSAVVMVATSVMAVLLVLAMRFLRRLRVARVGSIVNLYTTLTAALYTQGGDISTISAGWFCTIPLCATFILGIGGGMVAGAAAAATLGVFAGARAFGWFGFPDWPLRDVPSAQAAGCVLLVIGVGVIAVLYQYAKQLSDDSLEEARRHATHLANAKGEFLANMSHEIRTPMNAVIGMSYLALQTPLQPKQRNYVEKVHRSAQGLLGIINDILDYSKIESGHLRIERTDVSLGQLLDDVASVLSVKAEEKELEFLIQVAPEVPQQLLGDPLRLYQVLLNLGANAVKFTSTGEVVLGIEAVSRTQDAVELKFWIRDTGIGLTPEQIGRLFQSFSQADLSTTRKYGGTGLGLAISKRLVELMGGTIWVESEPGRGSVFQFTVSLGLSQEPEPVRSLATELAGKRLLVVDDNRTAREIIANIARTFGMEVSMAINGMEALQALQRAGSAGQPVDLLLLDWRMPVMDGLDCLQAVQEMLGHRAPAAVLMTAFDSAVAVDSARERGIRVQQVIPKPITASTLHDAISHQLGLHPAQWPQDPLQKTTRRAMARSTVSGARLLLVDDSEINQELATEILRSFGVTVVTASHGQQALELLSADPRFDGVLMDCQMPVMDGYEATRALRRMPAFQHLPILAMTANAMLGDRDKVLAAGMNDHISKPIDLSQMVDTLNRWIVPLHPEPLAAAPAGEGPPAEPDLMAPLPGIDTQVGLSRSQGDQALYLRLLGRFRTENAEFAARFWEAQFGPDPREATRLVHTLKGSAGHLGAQQLYLAASLLEGLCARQAVPGDLHKGLDLLLSELQRVLEGIATLEGAAPGAEPASHAIRAAAGAEAMAAPAAWKA